MDCSEILHARHWCITCTITNSRECNRALPACNTCTSKGLECVLWEEDGGSIEYKAYADVVKSGQSRRTYLRHLLGLPEPPRQRKRSAAPLADVDEPIATRLRTRAISDRISDEEENDTEENRHSWSASVTSPAFTLHIPLRPAPAQSFTLHIPTRPTTPTPTTPTPTTPTPTTPTPTPPTPASPPDTIEILQHDVIYVAWVRFSNSTQGSVAATYHHGNNIANRALDRCITMFENDLLVGRMSCVRVGQRGDTGLPTETTYTPPIGYHDDWPAVFEVLNAVIATDEILRPRVIFVCVSLSGISVSRTGWQYFYQKYLSKLRVEMLVLLRQEYPTGTMPFVPLLGSHRVKVGRCNLSAILRPGAERHVLSNMWMIEYGMRYGNLSAEHKREVQANDRWRNMNGRL